MKRLTLMALAVLVPAFASVSGVAADDKASHFKARLSGYQEVPSVSTVASGDGGHLLIEIGRAHV